MARFSKEVERIYMAGTEGQCVGWGGCAHGAIIGIA